MKKIIEIITANFPNGIRDDFIDTTKVLRIYSTNYADENISRELIAKAIHKNGILHGGRFYFISDSDSKNILRLINEILESHPIACYCAVYDKHADFFARRHIYSPDVLKKFLRETDTKNFYFDEFCSARRSTRLDYEVAKIITASEKSLSLDDLQKRLPYVPSEKISAVLSDTEKYLPTTDGKFIPLSALQFDTDEIDTAKRQIISAIDANGYAAPEDYGFSANFALNPELAEKDLRNVICEKFFAADFIKRGKRLFKRNDDDCAIRRGDSIQSLRKFIAEHDELSAAELFAFAKNFDSAPNVALDAAHERMIRVDKNLFVADSLISFDVGGVDEALSSFVQGKIISLRSVTSFTGFPSVAGYSWNLFMLESFLRKFSRRYVYNTPAANSANVGAIYPKSMKFADYLAVQVAVVVQENIPLEKSAVEKFLIAHGFRAKRIDKVTARIIARAQEISRQ